MPGAQTALSLTRASPIGGWNARDSLANMPPEDAIQLDNWFPTTAGVESRKGIGAAYATLTGITKDVDTLAVWNGPSSSKLWAFGISGTNAKRAFDVSATGAATADATFTGFGLTGTACRYSQAMFNNSAGYFLMLADNDGDHGPVHFNGTTWAQPTITGVTPANLVHVNLYKFRYYFVEKDSLNFWYLGLDAIAGAAGKFKLGGYCNEGGYLVATATWTTDGGEGGADDVFVAITSKGQIVAFQGDDPTSASSWSIAGVYKTAPPIGRNCFFRYGADLYVLTTDGIYPMADILANSPTHIVPPITDKIRLAFQNSARSFGSNTSTQTAQPGWSMTYYPRGRYIFVNVPNSNYGLASGATMYQYVQNVQTKSWCRFIGQNMRSWGLYQDELYCGTTGNGSVATVFLADSAANDAAQPIALQCRQAFDYFEVRGRNKQFLMARPSFRSDAAAIVGNLFIDTDFGAQNIVPTGPTVSSPGGAWDATDWDAAFWDPQQAMITDWQTWGGIGYCASLVVYIAINGPSISWYSTDWAYRVGGIL